MSSRKYLVRYPDGSRKHVDRNDRDSLLNSKEIKLVGPREYKFIGLWQSPSFLSSDCRVIQSSEFPGYSYGAIEARRRRENRIARADGYHTQAQWLARVDFYGWKCRYCDCPLTIETLTKDHQIAIANNGSEWASNLVPACKSCNSWKGARPIRLVS